MLAETGYDPIEMSRFFDTMRENERSVPEFLSDHPDTGNRAREVADARSGLAVSPRPITVTDGFWKMKSALRLLPPAYSMAPPRVGPDSRLD
jgi:predicted Zn-dependent protease